MSTLDEPSGGTKDLVTFTQSQGQAREWTSEENYSEKYMHYKLSRKHRKEKKLSSVLQTLGTFGEIFFFYA